MPGKLRIVLGMRVEDLKTAIFDAGATSPEQDLLKAMLVSAVDDLSQYESYAKKKINLESKMETEGVLRYAAAYYWIAGEFDAHLDFEDVSRMIIRQYQPSAVRRAVLGKYQRPREEPSKICTILIARNQRELRRRAYRSSAQAPSSKTRTPGSGSASL